jgi:hypothetical protein
MSGPRSSFEMNFWKNFIIGAIAAVVGMSGIVLAISNSNIYWLLLTILALGIFCAW